MWDREWLETLVANVPGAVYRCALATDWEMQFVSRGIEEITGYGAAEFIGNHARSFESVIHPDDRLGVEQAVEACVARRDPFVTEYRVVTRTGDVRWVHEQGRAVFDADGAVLYLDGTIFDIDERKRLEAQLDHLAHHDALTGLPNRRRLIDDLDLLDGRHILVFFDLDGFKAYNDAFGHIEGDLLLRRLSCKLATAVVPHGVAYRLGGDEFCFLAPVDDEDGRGLIAPCLEALSEDGEVFTIRSSWGSVLLPDEACDATSALVVADDRMYANKGGGRASARQQTRDVVLRVMAARHPGLDEHGGAVALQARSVGQRMGLDSGQLDDLERAAELHDIGKIAIPDAILNKPGPLNEEEWRFIRRHTVIGENMLSAAPAMASIARLVRCSHERWDGGGYPDGLRWEMNPLASRIIFVCDAFDAMLSERPYDPGRSVESALAELVRCAGSQFDPAVVAALLAEVAESALAEVA
jgi:two-component system cell cycle response regulator